MSSYISFSRVSAMISSGFNYGKELVKQNPKLAAVAALGILTIGIVGGYFLRGSEKKDPKGIDIQSMNLMVHGMDFVRVKNESNQPSPITDMQGGQLVNPSSNEEPESNNNNSQPSAKIKQKGPNQDRPQTTNTANEDNDKSSEILVSGTPSRLFGKDDR